MEIKINCLRNGIEGGGVSKGPATLLDGYGTYLYDLYKPSDEDVAAHPELADEPLGIAFPTGNLIETLLYSHKQKGESDDGATTTQELRQWRAIFKPHMYRYLMTGDRATNPESFEEYITNAGNIGSPLAIYTNNTVFGIYCAAKIKDVSVSNYNYTSPTLPSTNIDDISLTSVYNLGTYISNYFAEKKFTGMNPWIEKRVETGTSLYDMPMFMFRQPSFDSNNNVSHYYNRLFSADELSKINEADIEYYRKSAILIYKKDLMDFKNFFKKMMGYADEINKYSETLFESLMNQP